MIRGQLLAILASLCCLVWTSEVDDSVTLRPILLCGVDQDRLHCQCLPKMQIQIYIETGVISNKVSSLAVSQFKIEQLRLSGSSLDQGNCTASKRSSHLEKQLCWHQLFSCEMAIFGLTYCEDRFSPAIAQIMANVSHLVAINSSDDELVIILIKNTFTISSLHHMPSATVWLKLRSG